jgi:hypothetical protein
MIRNMLVVLGLHAATIAAVPPGGNATVTQPGRIDRTTLNFLVAVDGQGKIAAMRLMPNQ